MLNKFVQIGEALSSQWKLIASVVAAMGLVWLLVLTAHGEGHVFFDKGDDFLYSKYIDPIVGIGTFLIATLLGLSNIISRWEKSLEQRFTLHFVFDGVVLASFYDAFVVAKEDIRNQGQSLGRQLCGNQQLDLTSNNTLVDSKLRKIDDGPQVKFYKTWVYYMRLNSPPKFFEATNHQLYLDERKITRATNERFYIIYNINTDDTIKEAIKGNFYVIDESKQFVIDGKDIANKPPIDYKAAIAKFENPITTNKYPVLEKPKKKNDTTPNTPDQHTA